MQISRRLKIICGQLDALISSIEKKESCDKVTEQFYAVNSGLKKAMELYFKENLNACLRSANFKKKKTLDFLLREIIKNK